MFVFAIYKRTKPGSISSKMAYRVLKHVFQITVYGQNDFVVTRGGFRVKHWALRANRDSLKENATRGRLRVNY